MPLETGATSPRVLTTHLLEKILPRVVTYLQDLIARKAAQNSSYEAERKIREEQDRAYRESMNRDAERIRKKMEEERREEEKREKEWEDEGRLGFLWNPKRSSRCLQSEIAFQKKKKKKRVKNQI